MLSRVRTAAQVRLPHSATRLGRVHLAHSHVPSAFQVADIVGELIATKAESGTGTFAASLPQRRSTRLPFIMVEVGTRQVLDVAGRIAAVDGVGALYIASIALRCAATSARAHMASSLCG